MPAEGAMRTEVEAPGVEPRDVSGGVTVAGVQKAFGAVKALDGVSLRAAAREVVAVAGPSGCGKSTLLELVCGLAQPDGGTVEAPPAALMPQRDGLLPWLNALDNAALALRVAGVGKAGRARRRPRALRRLRARGLRARAAERAVGRHAPAGGVPADALAAPLCLDEPALPPAMRCSSGASPAGRPDPEPEDHDPPAAPSRSCSPCSPAAARRRSRPAPARPAASRSR